MPRYELALLMPDFVQLEVSLYNVTMTTLEVIKEKTFSASWKQASVRDTAHKWPRGSSPLPWFWKPLPSFSAKEETQKEGTQNREGKVG